MVKNTAGGSKCKGMARKDMNSAHSSRDYVPQDDAERYAQVTKMLGNGKCHVKIFMNDLSIINDIVCHIRGKFRSKNKRHNTISNGSYIVIGLRTWENIHKNCDLIAIVNQLPQSFNSLYHLTHNNDSHTDNILFQSNSEFITQTSITHTSLITHNEHDHEQDEFFDI
jgi:translation initiation factor IF-1